MLIYTSPEAVEKFCNETKVDSLTIAIGSAHGIYTTRLIWTFQDLKKLIQLLMCHWHYTEVVEF